MDRKSLLDDSLSGVGKKGGSSGGKKSSVASGDRLKLIVAIVGLIAGLGLVGYSQGMFDSIIKGKPKDITKTFTPEEKEKYRKSQEAKERLDREIPPSGS